MRFVRHDRGMTLGALAAVFLLGTGFTGDPQEGARLSSWEVPTEIQNDPFWRDYFTIESVEVTEVEDEGVGEMGNLDHLALPVYESFLRQSALGDRESFDGGGGGALVAIERVINLGERIWSLIEKNRPVVSARVISASALPEGVSSWLGLEGWRTPVSRIYRVEYTNLYGMTVVGFTYRVLFTYGGSYDGQGRYLARISVTPADLTVAWGYTFDVDAQVPLVTNAGSRKAPLAAAEIEVAWSVETVMKYARQSDVFYIRGDGYFEKMQ